MVEEEEVEVDVEVDDALWLSLRWLLNSDWVLNLRFPQTVLGQV